MRLALVAVLLLAAALMFAAFAWADQPSANELGLLMILEYHKVDYPEDRWTRTPATFRQDLEALYARGYRLHSLNALLDGRIMAPAGTTPIVLTFDDSSPGQFRYIETNGALEIDPKCAVGILEAFLREKPDFGRAATFYVLPGASKPNRLFNQPEYEGKKLQYLVSHGYEIGNHTLWHANLGKYDEAVVRLQIAEAQQWIQRHVPDYKIRTIALPHGVYPREVAWALRGSAKGVAAGGAPRRPPQTARSRSGRRSGGAGGAPGSPFPNGGCQNGRRVGGMGGAPRSPFQNGRCQNGRRAGGMEGAPRSPFQN